MKIFVSTLICLGALASCATPNPHPVVSSQFSRDSSVWSPTTEGQKHFFSGFTCPQNLGGWTFKDATINAAAIKGMDVGCHLQDENGGGLSFFLVHSSQTPNLTEHFENVRHAMRLVTATGDDRQVPTQSTGASVTALADATRSTPYDGRLRSDKDIQDTALWMEEIDFWHVYVRATYYRGNESNVADGAFLIFQKAQAEIPKGTMSPRHAEEE